MLIAAKRKKQEVAGKIGHDEYAYKIKGEASNLPENRRVREQGELTPYPANYNNNNNENVSRNAIHRPPYGIDEDNNNNKNINVTPTPSPFMAGYMSPYPQSPSPALGGPMYNNNSNNYYPNNNNNNYLYRPASTPIPAQSVVPPMPSLPPCPDLPGPLPSVYRPKPPLMLHRGVEGGENTPNDYLNIYNSGNNNNYLSPSLTCGVHANVPSALSQTPSLLPQIGKEYLHDNNAPLRIRSAPTPSSGNDPYNNKIGAELVGGNNGHNVFGVVDEKIDEIQRKLEERRKAQSLQQDNARQMEEQRLRKAAERAKQIQEEREEDERVQRERELVVAKEQTEIAREAYEKQLKENGPIAAEPFRIKYDECQRVQREKEMQQKDYKRISSATQRLAIPSNMALPITTTTNNPAPLPLQKTGEKESIQKLENNNKSQPTLQTTPEPSSSSSSPPSYQPSTLPDGNNQWPQNNPLAAPFASPTLYDTTSSMNINKNSNKMTLTPLWTPPTPSATPSSHISSALPTHDMALSLDPSYSNLSGSISGSNNKLYSAFNTHAVSSTLLSTPHLPHTSPLPSSRTLPETSKPHQLQLSSSFTYENDTLRDEIHELADNQQRMEHLLRSNEQVAQNITTSSLLTANVLNGLQTNNTPLLGNNNFNFNNNNNNNNTNFVPSSIINNRRNSNSSNGNSSARRRNGNNNNNNNNSRSRSNSRSNSNNENNNNAVVRSSTPNVVMTGNTFLTRNLVTPQPTLNSSNLLCSGSMNSLNGTNNINSTPYDANSTAPFIDNTYLTNTRLAANNNNNDIQDMDYLDNNNNNGSEGRRRTSLVKFTEAPDETPLFPKDLMVSTRIVGGSENTNGHSVNSIYNSSNNNGGGELNDALTARGDYLMNLAPLHSSNSDNHMPEIRMLEKELSVEPSLFVGASNTTQKAPQTNPKSSSSNTNANANNNTSTSSTSAIKAPVKGNTTTLTLSPRVLANASSSAKQRIIKEEDSSDEEETESDEQSEEYEMEQQCQL